MISSQLPRAKPSTLPAGHPPATAPPTRLRLPTPTAAVFSAFFQLLSPGLALPSPHSRPSQSFSSPICTPIDTAISIVVPAPSVPYLPRFRALALLGRLLLLRVDSVVMQASEKPQQLLT